ncbi:hypothetical protein KJ840_05315 [Patescibacteria group bacterium]|nr:hypothetical protein [Patescibacteria group bacterium]
MGWNCLKIQAEMAIGQAENLINQATQQLQTKIKEKNLDERGIIQEALELADKLLSESGLISDWGVLAKAIDLFVKEVIKKAGLTDQVDLTQL